MLRLAMITLTGVMLINNVPPTIAQGISQRIAQGTAPKLSITSQFPALKGINLTKEQEEQISSLTKRTIAEIEAKLTSEQRQQIKTALDEGKDLRTAVQSVSLSFGQKMSVRGIFQTVQSEMQEILTPAQYQQLEQNVRNRMNAQ